MDKFSNQPQFREKFKSGTLGVLIVRFFREEMKIEARANKKLIWGIFGGLVLIDAIISITLAVVTKELAFLAIIGIGLILCPLGFLEYNETIIINEHGVSSKGVLWPRPCKLTWDEIDRVADVQNGLVGYCIYMYKRNTEGKEKIKILIPYSPEAAYVVSHYYNKRFQVNFNENS